MDWLHVVASGNHWTIFNSTDGRAARHEARRREGRGENATEFRINSDVLDGIRAANPHLLIEAYDACACCLDADEQEQQGNPDTVRRDQHGTCRDCTHRH